MKFFPLLVVFPIKDFHIKSCISLSLFSCYALFTCNTPILLHLSLVVRIYHSTTCGKKSSPLTSAFIEICVPIRKISLQKRNLPQKASFTALMAPRKETIILNGATSKGKGINAIGGRVPHQPSINRVPLRTLAPPRLKRQSLVSNHHSSMIEAELVL